MLTQAGLLTAHPKTDLNTDKSDFSTETMEDRKTGATSLKPWGKKGNVNPEFYIQQKISLKGENKIYSDRRKLTAIVPGRPVL